MAFDNEELKKRREQREKLRQQRLRQQKQLIRNLIIAGVVLAVCAVVILAVSLGRNGDAPDPSQTRQTDGKETTQAQETAQPTEPPREPETTVIHFAAAGDLNVTDKVVASGGENGDFSAVFQDVVPLLAQADLTALNFEGNLVGAPYGSASVSAPQSLMQALANAGVDLVQMANSWSIYNGLIGLNQTLDGIRAAGLEPVGAYATEEEFRRSGGYTIREVDGIRVAIVAFTKGMDSMALPAGSEDCVNVLYTDYASTYKDVDEDGITAILRAVEEEDPDITIALLHWGSEYNDQISKSQTSIKNLMLSQGVDAIIGTHSHYVQEMEYDQEAGTLVAYSLGDFLGDGDKRGTNYSLVLDLEITKDLETGTTRITGYSYTPVCSVAEDGRLRILRVRETLEAYESNYIGKVSQETYEFLSSALDSLEDRIHPDKE